MFDSCGSASGAKQLAFIYDEVACQLHLRLEKSFVIHITDQRLLNTTGGIVQGMSGSPILQNGKVIGAVTHVFVQDAASGYGIFIENMLERV